MSQLVEMENGRLPGMKLPDGGRGIESAARMDAPQVGRGGRVELVETAAVSGMVDAEPEEMNSRLFMSTSYSRSTVQPTG